MARRRFPGRITTLPMPIKPGDEEMSREERLKAAIKASRKTPDAGRGFVPPKKQPDSRTPAPAKLVNGQVQTRTATQKQFEKAHPVLASKSGAARQKFLTNHPKIAQNVSEFKFNRNARKNKWDEETIKRRFAKRFGGK